MYELMFFLLKNTNLLQMQKNFINILNLSNNY